MKDHGYQLFAGMTVIVHADCFVGQIFPVCGGWAPRLVGATGIQAQTLGPGCAGKTLVSVETIKFPASSRRTPGSSVFVWSPVEQTVKIPP